jgi:hypothetical protein
LFYRLPKERLEGAAQVPMFYSLKYVNCTSRLISFQTGLSLSWPSQQDLSSRPVGKFEHPHGSVSQSR